MGALVHLRPQNVAWSDRQLDLIRRTVAADCNPAEFDLFCAAAQRAQLDPLKRQISAIVFNKKDAEKRRMSIITTIDGLRAIAARSLRYRPDEEEPQFEGSPELKGPANPAAIEKVRVRIYIKDEGGSEWRPVTGVAYWEEFAPLREDCEAGYEWVETGEFWEDSGKPKKRKQPKGATSMKLDTSGQWGRMPRLMLAKCAEAQALRKAFPEDLSGLYEAAEMDRARADEMTASERIEAFQEEARLQQAGVARAIMLSLSPAAGIEAIPLGQVADRCLEAIQGFGLRELSWFEATNTHPLREFWARAKGDALAVKKAIEERRALLLRAEALEG